MLVFLVKLSLIDHYFIVHWWKFKRSAHSLKQHFLMVSGFDEGQNFNTLFWNKSEDLADPDMSKISSQERRKYPGCGQLTSSPGTMKLVLPSRYPSFFLPLFRTRFRQGSSGSERAAPMSETAPAPPLHSNTTRTKTGESQLGLGVSEQFLKTLIEKYLLTEIL